MRGSFRSFVGSKFSAPCCDVIATVPEPCGVFACCDVIAGGYESGFGEAFGRC